VARMLAREAADGGTATAEADGGTAATEPRARRSGAAGSNFCKPYPTLAEAQDVQRDLGLEWLPLVISWHGQEVADLWRDYLTGGSAKRRFTDPDSTVVKGFATDPLVRDTQAVLMAKIKAMLEQTGVPAAAPGAATGPAGVRLDPIEIPLADLGVVGLEFPLEFGNPFTIPGNIAGGVGSGDAEADRRFVSGGKVTLRESAPGVFWVDVDIEFTITDTIDFCPGDPGLGIEQIYTERMSRLEATGVAGDVPYDVVVHMRDAFLDRLPETTGLQPPDAGAPDAGSSTGSSRRTFSPD
jgi:hypothetical protein